MSNLSPNVGLNAFGILTLNAQTLNVPRSGDYSWISTTFDTGKDAYLQDGKLLNDSVLRVDPGRRVSYIKSDFAGLSGTVIEAVLNLRVYTNSANGTVRVYRGLGENWTERSLSTASAPEKGDQVGVCSGTWNAGATYSIDVSSLVSADGVVSLILEMASGGNDVAFSSKEVPAVPALVVTTMQEETGGGQDALHKVEFSMPQDGQVFASGDGVDVVVNAFSLDSSIDIVNVKLYLDGAFVRQENIAPYEWSASKDMLLQDLAAGTHSLTAVATDSAGATAETKIAIIVLE